MKTKLYVKEVCATKHMSLKDLAEKLGITPSALSQIITSDNPGVKSLERIAEVLGVAITDLFIFPELSLGKKFEEYRNQLARDIFVKSYNHSKEDGSYCIECYNNAFSVAQTISLLGARQLGLTEEQNEEVDENWEAFDRGEAPYYADVFPLIMYVNGKPSTVVGVYSTFQKAIEAAENDAKAYLNNNPEEKNKYIVKVDKDADSKEPVVTVKYRSAFKHEIDDTYEMYEYFVFGTMLDLTGVVAGDINDVKSGYSK